MLLYGNGASGNRSHADDCGKNIASGRGIVTGLIVAAGLVIAWDGIGLEKVALKLCGSDLKGCAGAESAPVNIRAYTDRTYLNVGALYIGSGLEFVCVGLVIVSVSDRNRLCVGYVSAESDIDVVMP